MRRITMSKLKEVLRLKYLNQLSNRQIQTMTGISRSSVSNYIKQYEVLAISVEELLELSDSKLNELFVKKHSWQRQKFFSTSSCS